MAIIALGELLVMFVLEAMALPKFVENYLDPVMLMILTIYPLWRIVVSSVSDNQKLLVKDFAIEKSFFEQQIQGLNRAALVAVSDLQGRIKFVNENFAEASGFTKEDLVGRTFKLLSSQQHTEEFWQQMWNTISQGKVWKAKIRNHKKNGGEFWVDATIAPILGANAEVQEYLGIFYDITKEIEAEAKLELEKAKLVHASRLLTLGEMVGNIAHEVNNPLSVILTRAGQLKDRLAKTEIPREKIIDDLEKIENTARRISKIIVSLKTQSTKAETGDRVITPVDEIVKDVVELVADRFRSKNVNLKLDSEVGLTVNCRPVQIGQVLTNLLFNAQEAMANIEDRQVWLNIVSHQGLIQISISDNGPLIPADVAEKIMNPFFTTKPVGQGTGLGLSISKGIIEDHGGRLYLDRRSQKTKFVIELPLAESVTQPVGSNSKKVS